MSTAYPSDRCNDIIANVSSAVKKWLIFGGGSISGFGVLT